MNSIHHTAETGAQPARSLLVEVNPLADAEDLHCPAVAKIELSDAFVSRLARAVVALRLFDPKHNPIGPSDQHRESLPGGSNTLTTATHAELFETVCQDDEGGTDLQGVHVDQSLLRNLTIVSSPYTRHGGQTVAWQSSGDGTRFEPSSSWVEIGPRGFTLEVLDRNVGSVISAYVAIDSVPGLKARVDQAAAEVMRSWAQEMMAAIEPATEASGPSRDRPRA